jgi:hypothetical protein
MGEASYFHIEWIMDNVFKLFQKKKENESYCAAHEKRTQRH